DLFDLPRLIETVENCCLALHDWCPSFRCRIVRASLVDEHAADVLAVAHVLVAVVDALERIRLGDQTVEVELGLGGAAWLGRAPTDPPKRWSPERVAIQTLIDHTQKNVTGRVRLTLHKGNVIVTGRESPYSLFDAKISTFDDDGGAYNQADASGFIKLNALRMRIAAKKRR
ncbi:MAG: hypothetical protein ACO3PI_08545, partial [Burkholderiaceae bacterium]